MTPHILLYVNISLNMKYLCNIPKTAVPFDVYSLIHLHYQSDIAYLRIGGLAGCSGAGRPAGGDRLPEISCQWCIRMQETKFVYLQMIIKSNECCFESACNVLLVSGTICSIRCPISMYMQTYPWIWIFRRLLRYGSWYALYFNLISSEA